MCQHFLPINSHWRGRKRFEICQIFAFISVTIIRSPIKCHMNLSFQWYFGLLASERISPIFHWILPQFEIVIMEWQRYTCGSHRSISSIAYDEIEYSLEFYQLHHKLKKHFFLILGVDCKALVPTCLRLPLKRKYIAVIVCYY